VVKALMEKVDDEERREKLYRLVVEKLKKMDQRKWAESRFQEVLDQATGDPAAQRVLLEILSGL